MSRREELLQRLADLDAQLTARATASLHQFVKQSWPVVEPRMPFIDAWHVGAICEHLEAVARGQITQLGINVPPGTGKTTQVGVQFPAWLWAQPLAARQPGAIRGGPDQRITYASYDQGRVTIANTAMRDLILSDWYQARWPHVQLRSDVSAKVRYGTTAGGWRLGVSVAAPRMGEHPTYKIVDDAHNPKKRLLTEKEIASAQQFYTLLKVRGAPLGAATIVIMQRLHEQDLCGHLRETEAGEWTWLVLPMRWEPKRMVETPIGWRDPREGKPGELLCPAIWPKDKAEGLYKPESWEDSAQFQQRPAPAGGLMFKRADFRVIHALPHDVVAQVRAWDVAATDEAERTTTSARTAGVRVARTATGQYVILDVRKGWWGPAEVERQIKSTAVTDGTQVRVREECEGGSASKTVLQARAKILAGWDYRGIPLGGRSKVERATSARTQVENGNVAILVPLGEDGQPQEAAQKMAEEFLAEVELFPVGTLKDQVDAFAHAVNELITGTSTPLGIVTGYDTETPAERAARLAAYLREHGLAVPTAEDLAEEDVQDLLS